jgi:hypothetical protein
MNKIVLIGRVGRDPELRTSASGVTWSTLSVATNRPKKAGDAWIEETDWHIVKVFGKDAENLTLGADLAAAGTYKPEKLPAPSGTAEVNGYEVELTGGLRQGAASELKLKVSRDGRPVTDLQPYLGAYGHLVALRSGDLAYLHVHPNGEPGDGRTAPGPDISFTATAPSDGAYRLFLDFKHEGKVHTAAFTVRTGAADAPEEAPGETPESPESPAGHSH